MVCVSEEATVPRAMSLRGCEFSEPSNMVPSMVKSTTKPCWFSTIFGDREETRTFLAVPTPSLSKRRPIVAGTLGSMTGVVSGSSAIMSCGTK